MTCFMSALAGVYIFVWPNITPKISFLGPRYCTAETTASCSFVIVNKFLELSNLVMPTKAHWCVVGSEVTTTADCVSSLTSAAGGNRRGWWNRVRRGFVRREEWKPGRK